MRRIVLVVVLAWLAAGVMAGARRDYFTGGAADCDQVSTIAATILAGPFNYTGADPTVSCQGAGGG
ncbi:hypothetical protein [Catellatospora sp. NPDC049111]|jgi:hypothetical protein|uniref:hypothetical protein n=1 Tax=unclassified Catellatospora TaxID=2645785 RepID=UPI0033F27F2F